MIHLRQLMLSTTLVVAISAHVFVGSWLLSVFPRLRRHRARFIAAAVLAATTAPIGRLVSFLHLKSVGSWLTAAGAAEWMIVMLAGAPLAVIVLALRWLIRFPPEPVPPIDAPSAPPGDPEPPVSRRLVLERAVGLTVFGVAGSALGWGAVRGRHEFQIEEVVVRLAGLPKALDGYTIAQVSDLHAGLFVGDRELEEGFSKVRGLKADLVVATGDLVDSDARFAPYLARKLVDVRGRDGVFAILGNHDYYAGHRLVAEAMRAAGVELLVNEGRLIRPGDGGGFALIGVDDLWANRSGGHGPDLDLAIRAVPDGVARVLLAHQPNFFDVARGRVGLQLSGHTHGGQVNPGFRPADFILRYVAGRYESPGSTLWVNRGFGVAGPPTRIGAPPEVTKVVLVSA